MGSNAQLPGTHIARSRRAMRPLVLIASDPARGRADAALTLAASHAAIGAPTHLHLDAAATGHLADPTFLAAIDEARALGVVVTLCPTGLADRGLAPTMLADADRIGLVALLAELADDARLVVV